MARYLQLLASTHIMFATILFKRGNPSNFRNNAGLQLASGPPPRLRLMRRASFMPAQAQQQTAAISLLGACPSGVWLLLAAAEDSTRGDDEVTAAGAGPGAAGGG